MSYLTTFDIDNTLIRSSSGHVQALIAAIKEIYDLETSIDVINHNGMTDQEIISTILAAHHVDPKVIGAGLMRCMGCMQLQYAHIVKADRIRMLDGVGALLRKLDRNGFLLGLVTGNLEKIARAKLEKIGISHFFKFGGFGSDNSDRSELVRIAIKRAEERFDYDAGRKTFHFGDAPQDMQAARNAGVIPIGVATGIFSADELDLAGAYRVFPDLKDTDAILNTCLNSSGTI